MQAFAVVVRFDVVDDRGSGVGPGSEIGLVIHLVFQRREERFGDRVVPADADLTAGENDVVSGGPVLHVDGRVLGSSVAAYGQLVTATDSPCRRPRLP